MWSLWTFVLYKDVILDQTKKKKKQKKCLVLNL